MKILILVGIGICFVLIVHYLHKYIQKSERKILNDLKNLRKYSLKISSSEDLSYAKGEYDKIRSKCWDREHRHLEYEILGILETKAQIYQ